MVACCRSRLRSRSRRLPPVSRSPRPLLWLPHQSLACSPSSSEQAPEADLQQKLIQLQTQVARRARPGSNESRLNDPAPKQAAADTSTTRLHARSRALPLTEYAADGRYLAICPTQGVLSPTPDSPEWFDWPASLTAFTFQGANGRFSTTCKVRKGQRAHAWSAYRSLQGRSCNLYLGLTSHLTLAHLEHMAAKIQSHLPTF